MATVVVVGAGVGGLAAAARLAAQGHDVTVCEAAAEVGGKLAARTVTTAEGTFRFPLGPTLLTLPHVLADLFAATGGPLEDEVGLHRLDPMLRHRFADGAAVDTVPDLAEQVARFDAALGPGTGRAWQAVLDRGAAIWRAVEEPVFGRALSARTALLLAGRMRHLGQLRAVAPGTTLAGLSERMLPDARQRAMLQRYATYQGSDPRHTPAALAVVPYLEQRYGVWTVDGGLQRLAAALAARVEARGGRIRTAARVTAVERAGNRVTGVRLADGGHLLADVVVSDADAHSLRRELLDRPRAPVADSLSGFTVLLGLEGRTPGLAHHTVLFGAAPYADEFDAVFGRPGRPVADPVIYLNATSGPDAAPPGHEALHLLVNAPRHGPPGGLGTLDWDGAGTAQRYARSLLDLLAARGVDVRSRVRCCAVRTPADLERETLAPGGAIYGRAQHGGLATLRRPANRSRVRGLFLVGGSTHPGGGLPMVALSARFVADAIGHA